MIGFLRRRLTPPAANGGPPVFHLEGERDHIMETGRSRLLVTAGLFLLVFCVIAGRMVEVTLTRGSYQRGHANHATDALFRRADITDRNGVLLATSLPTVSLYAHPKEITDKAGTAERLHEVLPEIGEAEFESKLKLERAFVYLRHNLTPRQEFDVNALGVPGLYFQQGEKRIYPQGDLTAHVVGLTDLDNKGVAGIERSFDRDLQARHEPLRLSLDIRVQTILHNELAQAKTEFHAAGATGMVMDVQTGEIVAMVSLPDFDPNNLGTPTPDAMFNKATLGVYEMGSTFKLFNTAAVLDYGVAGPEATFDATHPITIGRFTIHDYHPENRWLTMPEILLLSSNLGSARMGMLLGGERQKAFLERLGQTKPQSLELPELGTPLVPAVWRDINTMTIAYGHGMAVTPLHLVTGVSALVNGGIYHPATLLRREDGAEIPGRRVIKSQTSAELRPMMRFVVTGMNGEKGTGGNAEVAGYDVGGKTGTAEKNTGGAYKHNSLLSSFIAAFPISQPRYLVLAMIDEPQGIKESHGFATGGWVAAPAAGRVIAQIGPLLGIPPRFNRDDDRVAQADVPSTALSKEITFAEAQ